MNESCILAIRKEHGMLEKIPAEPEKALKPLSEMTDADWEELSDSIKKAQGEAEEERDCQRRNARKPISVFAGHCRCGGKLTLRSTVQFVQTGEVRYGGPIQGYRKQTLKVSCAKCPNAFDAHHVMFRPHRYRINRIRRGH